MFGTDQYSYETKDGTDRTRLAVVMSQSNKPVFRHFDYGCPTIFVWESRSTYYTRRALRAVRHLAAEVRQAGYQSVCFVGCSKAGFGALLWSSLLADLLPRVRCAAIAFSPQTVLYPTNERLEFPSYRKLLARSEKNSGVLSDLKRHGRVTGLSDYPNLRARIIYPDRVETDRLEALRCAGPNVELVALPLSTHTTVIPYTVDVTDRALVESKVASLLNARRKDEDVASFVKDDQFSELVEEYQAIGRQPDLPALVAEMSAAGMLPEDLPRPTLIERIKAVFRKAA
jgi:hypothetical protein